MSTWHYSRDNRPCGPVDAAALQELLRNRGGVSPLPPDTLVWREGMANWTPAHAVPEFAAVITSPAAPPPLLPNRGMPDRPAQAASPPLLGSPFLAPGGPGGSGAPPPISPPPISAAPASAADPVRADIDQNKVFAVLAYLGILFLVPLLAAPNSPFARFHTNQGIVLFLSALILHFVGVLIAIVTLGIGALLMPVTWLLIIIFVVLGIVNAATGQFKPLPLIGHFRLMN